MLAQRYLLAYFHNDWLRVWFRRVQNVATACFRKEQSISRNLTHIAKLSMFFNTIDQAVAISGVKCRLTVANDFLHDC